MSEWFTTYMLISWFVFCYQSDLHCSSSHVTPDHSPRPSHHKLCSLPCQVLRITCKYYINIINIKIFLNQILLNLSISHWAEGSQLLERWPGSYWLDLTCFQTSWVLLINQASTFQCATILRYFPDQELKLPFLEFCKIY